MTFLRGKSALIAVLLTAAQPCAAGWLNKCAIALTLASPAVWNAIDPAPALPPKLEANEAELHGSLAKNVVQAFYGPLLAPINVINRRSVGHSPRSALETTVRRDYPFLLGYFGILLALRQVQRRFFTIPANEFLATADQVLATTPKKVLTLSSFEPSDYLDYFFNHLVQTRYEGHPNITSYSFNNLKELVDRLENESVDSDVNRLEIGLHGAPGRVMFADGSVAKLEDFRQALEGVQFRLMARGGEIVFFCCSVAVRTPRDNQGEKLLELFGESLLPEGGRVVGATKYIVARRRHPGIPAPLIAAMVHGLGLGNHEMLFENLGRLWRDFRDALKDAKVIDILPADSRNP